MTYARDILSNFIPKTVNKFSFEMKSFSVNPLKFLGKIAFRRKIITVMGG